MSSPTPIELLEDRIKFKLFAVDQKFKNLNDLEADMVSLDVDTRVKWEIIIEDLLSHLIGAKDALLVKINDKLELGLKLKDVNKGTVTNKLELKGKGELLKELNDLLDREMFPEGTWLLDLIELRNIGMHRRILNLNHSAGSKQKSFVADTKSDLDVIGYLEDRIQKMKELIASIINKEQLLMNM